MNLGERWENAKQNQKKTIGGMLKEWDKKFWANRKEELDHPDGKFEAALEVLEILPDGEIPEPLELVLNYSVSSGKWPFGKLPLLRYLVKLPKWSKSCKCYGNKQLIIPGFKWNWKS